MMMSFSTKYVLLLVRVDARHIHWVVRNQKFGRGLDVCMHEDVAFFIFYQDTIILKVKVCIIVL